MVANVELVVLLVVVRTPIVVLSATEFVVSASILLAVAENGGRHGRGVCKAIAQRPLSAYADGATKMHFSLTHPLPEQSRPLRRPHGVRVAGPAARSAIPATKMPCAVKANHCWLLVCGHALHET